MTYVTIALVVGGVGMLVAGYVLHGTERGCRWLSWHIPTDTVGSDGCSLTSTCRFCEKRVLQDSQGNWFSVSS